MIFLFLSLVVFYVKVYFLLASIYILVIFWKTRSWQKTVVYTFWPLAVYYVGQLYVFRVIQPEELKNPLYPDGRSLFFKFTPLMVLGVSMLVTWSIRLISQKIRCNWLIVILLIITITRQISAINAGILPWWALLGNTITNLSGVLWIWWVSDYLQISNKKEKMYFWKYFNYFLKTIVIIGSLLVIFQGLKGSGLGLVVEQSAALPYSGSISDKGLLNRPIGLWTHANDAAYAILCFLLAWGLTNFYIAKKTELINEKWLLLPLVALIWLQSRSVFLTALPLLGWGWYFYKEEIKNVVKKIKIGLWGWLVGLVIVFLGTTVITDRFWHSVVNFGPYDAWDVREKLFLVAKNVLSHHLWWGIGDGNFIPIAFREDMSETMKLFPEAVHNGWTLLLVEQGVIGIIIWIIFLTILIKMWWNFTRKNIKRRWYLIVLIVSQSTVMMFQPFSNILSIGVMLGMILLASEDDKEKKAV